MEGTVLWMCNQGCKIVKTTELSTVNLVVATNSNIANHPPSAPCGVCTALINVVLGKASHENESGAHYSLAALLYYSSEELVAIK